MFSRTTTRRGLFLGHLVVVGMSYAPCFAEPLPPAPVNAPATSALSAGTVHGVLVLRNGHVVEGDVQRSGDVYRIASSGAQFDIAAQEVEMYCGSAAEAYETKRRRAPDASVEARADLAEWCLRNKLWDQASDEIAAVQRLEPQFPRLGRLLAHRDLGLAQRKRQLENSRSSALLPPATPASSAASAHSRPSPSQTPTDAPLQARRQFARIVQPMLLAHCASAGCHRSGSDRSFQLNRMAVVGNGHAAWTSANLRQTLVHVDRQSPEFSPLLAYAQQLHGPSDRQSMALRPRQIELLRQWIALLAMQPELHPGPSTIARQSMAAGRIGDVDANGVQSAWFEAWPYEPTPDESKSDEELSKEETAHEQAPRDPFDPILFRHPKSTTTATEPPAEPKK